MTGNVLRAVLILLCAGFVLPVESVPTKDGHGDHDWFERRIKAAIVRPIDPATIEAVVGERATWNSLRPFERHKLGRHGIDFDPTKSEIRTLREANELVCWLQIVAERPKVVGVAWTANGERKLIVGALGTPE